MVANPFGVMTRRRWLRRLSIWIGLICLAMSGCTPSEPHAFSGPRAYSLEYEFLQFGPRVSGTDANSRAGDWIMGKLWEEGWNPLPDEGEYQGVTVRNIFGRKGQGPVIIVGTHFDSRKCADQPAGGCAEPVLGANDGASGVAILLELAHALDKNRLRNEIWLVFFDAEDNGRIDGWDWIVGSRQFALSVKDAISRGTEFRAMILLDMVGDADQQFYWEGNSDPALREAVWSTAEDLGYGSEFIPELRHTMIDDHIPFRDLGIPSVDIIDFDYPYWHTAEDTLDKTSADSLERVGRTVEVWLEAGQNG